MKSLSVNISIGFFFVVVTCGPKGGNVHQGATRMESLCPFKSCVTIDSLLVVSWQLMAIECSKKKGKKKETVDSLMISGIPCHHGVGWKKGIHFSTTRLTSNTGDGIDANCRLSCPLLIQWLHSSIRLSVQIEKTEGRVGKHFSAYRIWWIKWPHKTNTCVRLSTVLSSAGVIECIHWNEI